MLGAGRCLPYRVEEVEGIVVFVANHVEPTVTFEGEFDVDLDELPGFGDLATEAQIESENE